MLCRLVLAFYSSLVEGFAGVTHPVRLNLLRFFSRCVRIPFDYGVTNEVVIEFF